MAALAFVDAVITFDTATPLQLITDLKPNVLIKGADYKLEEVIGRSVVEENGGRVVLVQLIPDSSTTRIVEKMRIAESEAVA
jgi:D-beta-D-heptose 7-phosphate kinase/D-beta-D-heptose 1-phosphate adenosyltransferase